MPRVQAVLGQEFFARPALVVARELIGKTLVRKLPAGETSAIIHEVEAYVGPHDLACHGRFGRTKRTEVMHGPAGFWYVYLCYGMHWMLNVVTDEEDWPAAVLIRGDKRLNARVADIPSGLWIEDRGERVPRRNILVGPRVGIDYAGPWKDKPYRFLWKR
jgi:DNA-3-methyladenine glycosylase